MNKRWTYVHVHLEGKRVGGAILTRISRDGLGWVELGRVDPAVSWARRPRPFSSAECVRVAVFLHRVTVSKAAQTHQLCRITYVDQVGVISSIRRPHDARGRKCSWNFPEWRETTLTSPPGFHTPCEIYWSARMNRLAILDFHLVQSKRHDCSSNLATTFYQHHHQH